MQSQLDIVLRVCSHEDLAVLNAVFGDNGLIPVAPEASLECENDDRNVGVEWIQIAPVVCSTLVCL